MGIGKLDPYLRNDPSPRLTADLDADDSSITDADVIAAKQYKDDSLVGWYRGEADATDSSSYGNDGTLGGDATVAAGLWGNALSFDGTGDYVEIGDVNELDFRVTDDFTIASILFSSHALGSSDIIVDKTSRVCFDGTCPDGNLGVFADGAEIETIYSKGVVSVVPLPPSVILLGSGLMGLVGIHLKRGRRLRTRP